jgi:FixJ family two-component response regulator
MRDVQILKDRKKVLVVDDDPEILEGLQRLLCLHGYEPILFSSAKAFENHTDFDNAVCVILDIHLNDGSGIELLSDLQRGDRSMPVVCMTGDDNPAVRKAALNLGCIAFLTKPFSVQELIEPLKRAAARRCQDHQASAHTR